MKNMADHKSKLRHYAVPVNGIDFEYFDESGNPLVKSQKFSNSKHKAPF
jgi:hypothetical protein